MIKYRPQLEEYLLAFIKSQQVVYHQLPWANDVFTRLRQFVTSGKLLRGSLVVATYEAAGGKDILRALPAAAAIEMFQTAVLIHDDIIDQDQLRRGQPSIWAQYHALAKERSFDMARHTGESLALCVGDVGLFLAFELLAQLDVGKETLVKIQTQFVQDVIRTGLAEMRDVELNLTPDPVGVEDVLELHRYKTGRYTFSLPLMMGGLLAELKPELVQQLGEIGETLGIIFQIKDDELGLFGDEEEIGKTAGSDVREGKKTLQYLEVLQRANDPQRQQLKSLFGKDDLSENELEQVRTLVRETGAQQAVEQRIEQLTTEVQEQITALTHPPLEQFLNDLLAFNISRKK